MERFYTDVLGLMVTDQGEGRAGMHLTFMSGNVTRCRHAPSRRRCVTQTAYPDAYRIGSSPFIVDCDPRPQSLTSRRRNRGWHPTYPKSSGSEGRERSRYRTVARNGCSSDNPPDYGFRRRLPADRPFLP